MHVNNNAVMLHGINIEQLELLIKTVLKNELEDFKQANTKPETKTNNTDDLLTRNQVLELLKINASTLHNWQKKGYITVYKFSNRCYYKKSELLTSLVAVSV
jgi:hypothetical protein